jgi:hypothetical protein
MKIFNEKAHYPFTYGDKNADEVMLSDYVVELMKTKRFQSHMTSAFFALLTLGSYAQPSSAIPPEYGEAANEMLNQAAQNGAAGGAPAVPPIGQIQGQVPGVQGNPQYVIPAMPIEQQRLIAAQQAGQAMPDMALGEMGPTSPPPFYIPDKPRLVGPRAANTVAFTTALGVICLNAAWGEPVAIMMCSSGIMGIAYKLGKEVVIFIASNMK